MSLAARKITPVQIVDDVEAAADVYAALGFVPVKADQNGAATGWQADNGSHVVVAAHALIAKEFGEDIAQKIATRSLSYVFVESVPDTLEDLGTAGKLIAEAVTSYGTIEAIVETAGGTIIIAERIED